MEDKQSNPIGRPKNIESPEHLWKLFRQYKTWAKENPYEKHDFVGKDGDSVMRKFERPLSFAQFEGYLCERMIISDLGDYQKNKDNRYADFAPIIRAIKKIIFGDQFDGAAAGVFKENIIARVNGLADKQESRQVDKDGKDVPAAGQILIVQGKGDEDLEIKEQEE